MSVFEKTPRHCLHVPNSQDWSAKAIIDCTIAVCFAPEMGHHGARRIGPDGIELTQRGEGVNTRYINNIAMTKMTSPVSPIWKRPIIIV